MRKAISPVISIILLIFITITAGVGAYAWINTVQSDLQEGISANVESFPGSDCSQLNLIAMRGDGVVISNVGCDTIGSVNVFIDGVLTDYDLNAPLEPGQAITITFTALSPNASHTLQIVLDNGKVISESVSELEATSEAGFTGGEEEPEGFTCEESSCSVPYIMFTGDITDSLNNACPCCGDDNVNDVFYNSTHMCSYGGVIFNADALYTQDWYADRMDYASGRSICELKGFKWIEGTVSFAGRTTKAAGSSPYYIAVGEFNGDGNLDVVTSDYSSGTFSFFAGNGAGGFADRTTKSTGTYPYVIDTGDFNEDNYLDVVVIDNGPDTFSFFAGNGDGTFADRTSKETGITPMDLAIGDLNKDGHLDVIIVDAGSKTISFFAGNGDGTFADRTTKATDVHYNPVDIDLGDFNEDGNLDVVILEIQSNLFYFFAGNGDGTFQDGTSKATGTYPHSMGVGDFNNDGHLDVVVGDTNSDTFSFFAGNGDGTFADRTTKATGLDPTNIIVGDFDNDGDLDVIVTDVNSNTISIFKGNGDGTFADRTTKATSSMPSGIATGDFDNDGDLDVVSTSVGSNLFDYFSNTGLSGSNGPCCGDDGATDDFSNSTHQCVNGVFSAI